MNKRLEHLIKAGDAISNAIAHLQRIDEDDLIEKLRAVEKPVLDMQDGEPALDPDPYLTELEEA
jgi:hypothetical protein